MSSQRWLRLSVSLLFFAFAFSSRSYHITIPRADKPVGCEYQATSIQRGKTTDPESEPSQLNDSLHRIGQWDVNIQNAGTPYATTFWFSPYIILRPREYYVMSYNVNKEIGRSTVRYKMHGHGDNEYWGGASMPQSGHSGTHSFKMPEANPVELTIVLRFGAIGVDLCGTVDLWQIGP